MKIKTTENYMCKMFVNYKLKMSKVRSSIIVRITNKSIGN